MHVEIIAVGGMQSLVDNNTTSHIILRMPNADQISVTVDGEIAQAILDGAFDGLRKAEEPLRKANVPELDIDPGDDVVQEIFSAPDVPEDMIEWRTLPEESLSTTMKQVLERADIPNELPASELVELIDAITRQENAQRAAQAAQASQPPQQQSTVGRVQQLRTPPRRTVPMDEKGYPIVAQQVQDRDPGEVATMGADEDGVPQA